MRLRVLWQQQQQQWQQNEVGGKQQQQRQNEGGGKAELAVFSSGRLALCQQEAVVG